MLKKQEKKRQKEIAGVLGGKEKDPGVPSRPLPRDDTIDPPTVTLMESPSEDVVWRWGFLIPVKESNWRWFQSI